METTFSSTGSDRLMLTRRSVTAKNQLLNLAFEDGDATRERSQDLTDQPKGVPADLFKEGVRQHASMLGMEFPEDEPFLWVAEESLLAPLPEAGWVQLREEESGHPYYYNQVSGESSWEHPRDNFYKALFYQKKEESGLLPASAASLPMPPEPPSLAAKAAPVSTSSTAWARESSARSGLSVSEYFTTFALTCCKPSAYSLHLLKEASAKETDRLKKQLERQKTSKEVMLSRHEQAISSLEQEKEDLEEKLEAAVDKLREERRKNRICALEQEKSEKAAQRLRESSHDLEKRLEEKIKQSGELLSKCEDMKSQVATCRQQLEERQEVIQTFAVASPETWWPLLCNAHPIVSRRIVQERCQLHRDREAFEYDMEQAQAKLNFQVGQWSRRSRFGENDQILYSLNILRKRVHGCLGNTKREITGASSMATSNRILAAHASAAAEHTISGNRRSQEELESEISGLNQNLAKVEAHAESLSADLKAKTKIADESTDLQRALGEAQERLGSANQRFHEEVMRMNAQMAEVESTLEEKMNTCKELQLKIEEFQDGKQKLEATITAHQEEVHNLSRTKVRLEAEVAEANARADTTHQKVSELQQQVKLTDDLERDLARLRREAQDLQHKADYNLEEKQRELAMATACTAENERLTQQLHHRMAEVEGRASQDQARSRATYVSASSLESQLLECRALLAAVEVERDRLREDLDNAKKAMEKAKELESALLDARSEGVKLSAELETAAQALKGSGDHIHRERNTWAQTRKDLEKRAEGAEKRCDTLRKQKEDLEERYQQELDKAKDREAGMWAQLQQVSSSFAAVASTSKAGEDTLDAKVKNLEERLRASERQAIDAELETRRCKEAAERDTKELQVEVETLRERLARKKDKSTAQRVRLEEECRGLLENLAKTRAAEEGLRLRCEEAKARAEEIKADLEKAEAGRSKADQEQHGGVLVSQVATMKEQGERLSSKLKDMAVAHQREVEQLEARINIIVPKEAEAELEEARKGKEVCEVRCQVLQEAMSRLEEDLSTLRAQVRVQVLRVKFKGLVSFAPHVHLVHDVPFCSENILLFQEEVSSLSAKLSAAEFDKHRLEEQLKKAEASTHISSTTRVINTHVELDKAKRRTEGVQGQIEVWKMKCQQESALRRSLHQLTSLTLLFITWLQGSIRVLCRLRPLQPFECEAIEADPDCEDPVANISYPDFDKLKFWGVPYEFDHVFGPGTRQAEVFHQVQPIVASALDGYRVCVFAYGQTGSGKTYTMEGPTEDRGVNFRALGQLFELSAQDYGKTFQFRVSMLEVYNESIKDLFVEPGRGASGSKKHDVRLDKKGRVYVEGLVECQVETLQEVEELLQLGSKNRTVGNNNVNEHSSRSHLVLQVLIMATDTDTGQVQHGKLNLIDLAGSERIKSTAAEGQQLKEAQNINRSLSALGDVIHSLGLGSKHVPYRNSKLTFLLQDSLSANAKVLMFVNINPNPHSQSESICSLNFAKRCHSVQLGAARRLVGKS
ncbi:unnamed protein product [Discosporangium mesarthrocarpum]